MYVLQREDGKYVAPAGRPASYTSQLQHARVFTTREQAQREACGNERIVSVNSAFH